MKSKIIITAFKPFDRIQFEGRKINVSSEVLENIQKTYDLESLILPVEFKDFKEIEYIKRLKPDYILSLGESAQQYPGMESKAKNFIKHRKIMDEGVKHYMSKLPTSKIVDHLKSKGYEIKLSDDAGLYVCNFTFYNLSQEFKDSKTKVGFMHLPREGNVDKLTELTYLVTDFLRKEKS